MSEKEMSEKKAPPKYRVTYLDNTGRRVKVFACKKLADKFIRKLPRTSDWTIQELQGS
jgi:hypothetical protein